MNFSEYTNQDLLDAHSDILKTIDGLVLPPDDEVSEADRIEAGFLEADLFEIETEMVSRGLTPPDPLAELLACEGPERHDTARDFAALAAQMPTFLLSKCFDRMNKCAIQRLNMGDFAEVDEINDCLFVVIEELSRRAGQ